ncbi:PspC domain-containing protein [Bacillus sp. 2205SS5-2]|uniref:PspC domain-containing protein n=1 Tax=Bacillus sp. 2205SS5-2 TaxID=3109031 RepID=UPI003004A668
MMSLTRSESNKVVFGIIGGLSKKLGMNATLLRIIFAVLVFATGFFPIVFIYIILAWIIPKERG